MIAFKPLQIIENINNGGDVGFDIFFFFFFQYYPLTFSSSISQTLCMWTKITHLWLQKLVETSFSHGFLGILGI